MAEAREAHEVDIPEMLKMGRAMHAESPRFSRLRYSETKAEDLLRHMIVGTLVTDALGGGFVVEKEGKLVGMLLGYVTEYFFSEERIATDLVVYVRPEHRGGRTFSQLVHAFERWAASKGVREIMFGISTEVHVEATTGAYERMGYAAMGRLVLKKAA